MQFKLTLTPLQRETFVPFNYQYPLSAVIYQKIAQADAGYAEFLHQKGYAQNRHSRHFKFFTFSNLQAKFIVVKEALKLQGNQVTFVLACHMPEFAENLVKGIFASQNLSIGDRTAQANFTISQIEAMPFPIASNQLETVHTLKLKLLSPMVVCRKNERGNEDYLSPEDAGFISLLKQNLVEKLIVAFGPETAAQETQQKPFEIQTGGLAKLQSRLLTIKAGKAAETKVRGFLGFDLEMRASGRVLEMALNAGLGNMNAIGFGCVGEK
ncbi:CRISPR-associated endoribonuclease Cas6 [uncultured Mucilaginibacter sp.]|uniref:CRISPR-associated endoribonuclease Cas6 n=1 Tax=uncultured Mucilaginibacter sp. TaxID=797541 RepID=UPI002623414B|nr:CRISPR-associated endoribonuclease Cas6 [uncultured Mucilaginibacter sp.]